jgi:oxygen-independent coproporphyrinogen-3 oxidase
VKALIREMSRLPDIYRRSGIPTDRLSLPVDTIYIGGGTPSLLGKDLMGQVVESLRERLLLSAVEEFTLELTPGSADESYLLSVRRLGVNRLSIGAQAFSDRELRAVGRLHSAQDTVAQVLMARQAGFNNLSLDLIAGLPLQTEASWRETLEAAVRGAPEHISIYLYELDENSRLGKEAIQGGSRYRAADLPTEEFSIWAYEFARERLATVGYAQYEISNFALSGFESRHNLKYWQLEPYLGFGAGAHSYDGARRWSNCADVETYARRLEDGESPISEICSLSTSRQVEEFFFLGLRRREGVELREANERWGEAQVKPWEATLNTLTAAGWLEWSGSRLRLAPRALLVSNEIFQQFIEV